MQTETFTVPTHPLPSADADAFVLAHSDIWTILYRRNTQTLASQVSPVFVEALNRSEIGADVPVLEDIEAILQFNGWTALPLVHSPSYPQLFEHFSQRRFPIPLLFRDRNHLDYTKTPDFFSRCFAQLPMMMDGEYCHVLEEFGRVAQREVADPEMFEEWLKRLYWFGMEKVLFTLNGVSQPIGALLVDSLGERSHCLLSSVQKPFGMHPVIRTPIAMDAYQSTYYTIDSFSQVKRALVDLERMYRNA